MRKAYMYTLDAAVAVVILIIGIILIASLYTYTPDKQRTDDLNEDIIGLLSSVRVSDLCSDVNSCACSYQIVTDICSDGRLKNRHATLMDVMGQLYHDHERQAINDLINQTIIDKGILPGNFRLQIVLIDPAKSQPEQLYPLVP